MKKQIIILILSALLILTFVATLTAQTRKAKKSVKPEVLPVQTLIRAVLYSDLALYKSVWALREIEKRKLRQKDWRDVRAEELEFLKSELGDFKLSELEFKVEDWGEDKNIKLISVKTKNKEGSVGYTIVKEKGIWKCFIPPVTITKENK